MTDGFKQFSYDMNASFKKLSEYLTQIEDNNERRFQSIETTQREHSKILGEHTRILGEHSQRLDRIETTLDDHTKRLGRIETTLDEHSKRFGTIETLLTQILARLPENR